jgi:signal transduction histidine kinase
VQPEWIKSPAGRLVLAHWADARPAWLWSQDGETLLWRNDAARYFHGRAKKHGVKLAPEAVPIRGQIARLIRLGSMNRPSLSRIQFLAGEKPVSTTCTCTPLQLADGELALLIVGVDPVDAELLDGREIAHTDPVTRSILPDAAEFLLVTEDGQIAGGSPHAIETYGPIIESEGLPIDAAEGRAELAGETLQLTRFKASPHDAMLLLFEGASARAVERTAIADIRAEEGEAAEDRDPPAEPAIEHEPLLPLGLPPAETPGAPAALLDDHWVEPIPASGTGELSSLFDRLADDPELYAPLSAADERFDGPPPAPVEAPLVPDLIEAEAIAPVFAIEDEPVDAPVVTEPDVIAALIEYADEPDEPVESSAMEPAALTVDAETPPDIPGADASEPEPVTTWRVIGRGFVRLSTESDLAADIGLLEQSIAAESTFDTPETAGAATPSEVADLSGVTDIAQTAYEPPAAGAPPDAETVERVSRYNFDELSRILTDRVSGQTSAPDEPEPARPVNDGALVNLSGETFILNRLPLGILVFRDQQVLFANRALTDLTGYENIESLRAAGLTAIFPSEEAGASGPVTQLVRRDGGLVSVNARLQSITWHGRPALMLSASAAENRIGHEAAVRAFAQLAAETTDDGFIAADTAGIVTSVSLHARIVLGATEEELVGKPIASLIEPGQLRDLRQFLERPARFAETSRPAIYFNGALPNVRIGLFAQGQAGIVTGYFAFVRKQASTPAPQPRPATPADEVEPSILTRISRSIRRPLNTVIGFAEMIRSSTLGSAEGQRTLEYAQDIRTAGQEIATLIDELDDYARLKDGRYPSSPDDIDLAELLELSLARVRPQAGDARVLVRSAVSEQLPHITADRASLTQAVLNLLASAIDQTPAGGSVILSAQIGDDGAVVVNVRDNGETRTDLGERFVVFRDGVGKDGEALQPVRSSVGLALTRSLLAVNALSLSVDPAAGSGNLFSLIVPADLVRS